MEGEEREREGEGREEISDWKLIYMVHQPCMMLAPPAPCTQSAFGRYRFLCLTAQTAVAGRTGSPVLMAAWEVVEPARNEGGERELK